MVDQRVVDYVSLNLSKGYPLEQIRQKLAGSGLSETDISEAISLAGPQARAEMRGREAPKAFNKWVIIIPFLVLIIIWIVFAFLLFRG